MARNEKAKATIYLDGKQAEAALDALTNKAKEVRLEMKRAQEAGDQVKFKKLERELKGIESTTRSLRKETFDYEKVLRDINGASMSDIKKALRTVEVQLNKMKRTDPGHAQKASQAKLLRAEMTKINSTMRSQGTWISKASDKFNKYFSIVTAGAASVAGLILGGRKAVQTFNDFEETTDNLQALTGLANSEMKYLEDQAKKTSTATIEGGVRIKQSTKDIVDAYTLIGSQRPELLKNKEALHEITKEAIILSEAAKMELEPSAAALTNTLNQFQEPASQSRRIINALSAGSQAGAGNIEYLSEAVEKMGTTANLMNIEIEETFGLIEMAAPFYKRAEMAGNSLDKVLLKLKANQIGYKDGIFDINRAIEELRFRFENGETAAQLFGVEHAKMGELLVANQGEFKRYTQLITGSNKAIEQAAINTDNNNAKLAQAKNRMQLASMELGKKLAPAMTMVHSKGSMILKFLTASIDLFSKHGKTILVAGSAIAAYTIAINAQIIKQKVYNALTAAGTTITKGFNTAVKTNPLGLLASLLTAAATAYFLFRNKASDAKKEQKEFNKTVEEGNRLLSQNKTLEERASIIKNLSKDQLLSLKDDLQSQIKAEEDFHAKLLQQLKKRLTEDSKLKELYERRNQEGLTQIQKINLSAQINARKQHLSRELEEENKTNQLRIEGLKKHLQNVSKELEQFEDDQNGKGNKKILALLLGDYEKQKDAVQKYFSEVGKGAFEAFMAAFEKGVVDRTLLKQMADSLKEEEEEFDPALSYEIKKYQKTDEYKRHLLESQRRQGLIGEQEYQDRLNELLDNAEKKKFEKRMSYASKAQMFAEMGTNVVMSLMDLELEKAGDNEEKKKQIKKKYADINFITTAAHIVASTAMAIMEGYAQLGPIAGSVAAVLLGATGLVQLGIANTQRKKVKSLHIGGHTGPGGKYEPKGIVHAEEYVIPMEGTHNPGLRELIDVIEIARNSGSLATISIPEILAQTSAKQLYSGGSVTTINNTVHNPTQPYSSGVDTDLRNAIIGLNEKLKKPLKANVSLLGEDGFVKAQDKLEKITNDVNL